MPTVEHMNARDSFRDTVGDLLTHDRTAFVIGFDVTRHFGPTAAPCDRVIDTPICEETILGAAVGLYRSGSAVVVDLMFEAFLLRCFDVLANQAPIRHPHRAPGALIVRAVAGPFEGAGPQHCTLAGELLRAIPQWNITAAYNGMDVTAAFETALASKRPHLLLTPAEESSLRGGVGSRAGRRLRVIRPEGTNALIVPARIHAAVFTAIYDLMEDLDLAIVETPVLAPFPWDELAELCSQRRLVGWMTMEQLAGEERARAALLGNLCNREVSVLPLCRHGAAAYSRAAVESEARDLVERFCRAGGGSEQRGGCALDVL